MRCSTSSGDAGAVARHRYTGRPGQVGAVELGQLQQLGPLGRHPPPTVMRSCTRRRAMSAAVPRHRRDDQRRRPGQLLPQLGHVAGVGHGSARQPPVERCVITPGGRGGGGEVVVVEPRPLGQPGGTAGPDDDGRVVARPASTAGPDRAAADRNQPCPEGRRGSRSPGGFRFRRLRSGCHEGGRGLRLDKYGFDLAGPSRLLIPVATAPHRG